MTSKCCPSMANMHSHDISGSCSTWPFEIRPSYCARKPLLLARTSRQSRSFAHGCGRRLAPAPLSALVASQEVGPGTHASAAGSAAVAPPQEVSLGAMQEAAEEARLRSRAAASSIYGIPRSEWLRLQTPARYLGNEFGAIHKPWDSAEVRFALTYPESYEVGASNLGHVILYSVLNGSEALLCDRAYFPGDDLQRLLARYEKPLFAVESRRPLAEFDVLGFSLSYELGGTNILEMLRLSGIPVSWEERREAAGRRWDVDGGSYPLIFAGGPTATSNPEPFADFFDFVALGDGEELLVEIGQCLRRCKAEGLDREGTLFQLATSVAGIYVPQFYSPLPGFGGAVFPNRDGVPARVQRRTCAPDPFQQIGLVPFVQTVHDRLTVEIRRGCTRGCRFCQPGMLTRPARDVDPDRVVDAVEEGMRRTGYNEFSLLSLSCSDYLALPSVGIQIKNRLRGDNVTLSLPSQRVDRFDDDIANIISSGMRRSGLTFAPEAGTQRMRDIINKGLTNEELLRGVKTAWDRGWAQVKLYFMIGLPGETDADMLGIAETIEWLQRECATGRRHMAVNVTISNFTPKPHTPFQWHSVSTAEFIRKQGLLREVLGQMPQVKANFTDTRLSAMEDFIGRGDRRLGAVVRGAWQRGATNDKWWMAPEECFAAWEAAIAAAGLSWKYRQVESGEWNVLEAIGDERFRRQGGGGRGRLDRGDMADSRLDMPLPWDHIDTGIAKWWLKADLQRALEAATLPDCSHSGHCSECGVCGDELGENVVFEPPPVPPFQGHYEADTRRAQRLRFRFSKGGDAVFIGHLDMMRAFDRACRRAALPVSATESPFHAQPRIYSALPLPLGATGGAEVLELHLTEPLDLGDARRRLEAQLPAGLEILSAEEVPVRRADGAYTEKLAALLQTVTYHLAIHEVASPGDSPTAAEPSKPNLDGLEDEAGWEEAAHADFAAMPLADEEGPDEPAGARVEVDEDGAAEPSFDFEGEWVDVQGEASSSSASSSGPLDLRECVSQLRSLPEFLVTREAKPPAKKKKKKGGRRTRKKKAKTVDLKTGLVELAFCADPAATTLAQWAPEPLAALKAAAEGEEARWGIVSFTTSCLNGNPQLSPAALVRMLSTLAGRHLAIAHLHRSGIGLAVPTAAKPDHHKLRSILLWEGHVAAARRFRGEGPWRGGLEERDEAAILASSGRDGTRSRKG